MNGRLAGRIFLGLCLILAVLLATNTIGFLTSGSIFAVALILLGSTSRGFKKGSGR